MLNGQMLWCPVTRGSTPYGFRILDVTDIFSDFYTLPMTTTKDQIFKLFFSLRSFTFYINTRQTLTSLVTLYTPKLINLLRSVSFDDALRVVIHL